MAENKIIVIFLLKHFFAVNDQPFLLLAQEPFVDLTGDGPAATAEPAREAHTYRRREDAEQPLTDLLRKIFLRNL
jgi:hypothetical protein